MNDRSFDQLVDDWMELGPKSAPGRVGAAARLEVRSAQQTAPWSWSLMRYDVAAVAMVAIVLAIMLLTQGAPGGRGAGTPGSPSTSPPPPTTRPAASVGELPEACAAAAPSPEVRPVSADFSVGRHSVTFEGFSFAFCAPSYGWEPYADFSISKSEFGPQGAEAILYWAPFEVENQSAFAGICMRLPLEGEFATPADLATAIASLPGIDLITGAAQVQVGGREAWHLAFVVRADEGCDPGFLHQWRPRAVGAMWVATEIGDTIHVWVLDVDGRRLVIGGELHPEASDELELELLRIVESITFE